jgi:hypothetical protein
MFGNINEREQGGTVRGEILLSDTNMLSQGWIYCIHNGTCKKETRIIMFFKFF